jgi:hypothetical protein
VKPAPTDDELVAIVAAYAIVMRDGRALAPVPAPAWRRAARLEGVDAGIAASPDPERRTPWRASTGP